MSLPEIESVLRFWFGELDGPHDVDLEKNTLWWKSRAEDDLEIRERFGELHGRAVRGELDAWGASPRGRLALVLLLDQMSRSLGRGTPEAFAADPKAQSQVNEAIEQGQDRELRLIERCFLYMPLMHAEDRQSARRSCALFEALDQECAAVDGHPKFGSHAQHHAEIVERFGRYPHRNTILGRAATAEEEAYLADGGPSFGQTKR